MEVATFKTFTVVRGKLAKHVAAVDPSSAAKCAFGKLKCHVYETDKPAKKNYEKIVREAQDFARNRSNKGIYRWSI